MDNFVLLIILFAIITRIPITYVLLGIGALIKSLVGGFLVTLVAMFLIHIFFQIGSQIERLIVRIVNYINQ